MVLEIIKNNLKLDVKPSSICKVKGPEGKYKVESMDSRIPPKPNKVTRSGVHCILCKQNGGPHKSQNVCDCCHFIKDDSTLIKKNGCTGKPHSKDSSQDGANFAQMVRKELKETIQRNTQKYKRQC